MAILVLSREQEQEALELAADLGLDPEVVAAELFGGGLAVSGTLRSSEMPTR